MRTLLVFAALLGLLATGVNAKPERDVVVVENALPDSWTPALKATIRNFNRNMPRSGPKLVYKRVAPDICLETMTVCGGDGDNRGLVYWGLSYGWNLPNDRDKMIVIDITASGPQSRTDKLNTLCHEFMHQLAHIPDNYGARPTTSCVWGRLDHLGTWDIQRLQREYGGHRGR